MAYRAYQNDSGSLRLEVEWYYDPNSCGYCLYDFSFEVADVGVTQALVIEIATRDCIENCSWDESSKKLPVDEKAAGIICEYDDAVGLFGMDEGYWQLARIIHRSRGASLCLRHHSTFASFTNTESIRSVTKSTVMSNPYAIHSLSGELSRLGELHVPPDDGVCEDGLTVIVLEDGNEICAATCDEEAPCPLEEILECRDGVCRLIDE